MEYRHFAKPLPLGAIRSLTNMIKQLSIFITTVFFTLLCRGQENFETKLIGKWGICYELDTVDADCNQPFNFYIFEIGGRCTHGAITISGKKIPVLGSWRYEKGNLEVVYDKHPNYSYPKEVFRNIIVLNDDLFYIKFLDKVESPGHWVFYSFKRIK